MAKIEKEMIMDVLKEMELRPKYDEDGDIHVKYQMREMLVLPADDDTGFVSIVLTYIYGINNNNEQMCSLYVCNKMTSETRQVKIWLNEEMNAINASSEFFADSKDSLRYSLEQGLSLLSTIYYMVKKEMNDYMEEAQKTDKE